ncbi:MAG: drug/metabolite transporter (DMT)-like permease [Parasphingorhabdus sp.]
MTKQKDNIPVGISFMLLTMFFFVSLDSVAKYLMQFYPVMQVIWGRFFFHMFFVLLALVMMRSNLKQKAISRRPGLQIWRSILMLLTNGLFFTAVRTVELTTASTIMFLTPIVVTILAIPILGERVGIRRWTGVIIGFIGAIIIVRPGVIDTDPAILILVATTVTHAFYQLLTRQVRDYDDPITSLLYTGLIGTIVMSLLAPLYWIAPLMEHWPLFILMGLVGSVGHFCLIQSLRAAPISVVSPFSYTTLIWATAYSYFLFNELPDYWVYVGGSLILGSGLYILHRERQLKIE